MSNFLPNAGEDSPHTGILRINWEVFPTNQDGTYGNTYPVDLGLLLMRTDKKTFKETKIALEKLLKKFAEEEGFIHIFKEGRVL